MRVADIETSRCGRHERNGMTLEGAKEKAGILIELREIAHTRATIYA